MNLKIPFFLILIALFLSFASCLDSNETTYTYSSDAEIISFSLTNDSISQLKSADSTKFSIDQIKGLIYNADSLRFGTVINYKLIMKYMGGAGVLNVTNGDSTWIASGDSVDFSQPVKLKVWAPDGVTTKNYTVEIKIHKIDPDSIQYKELKNNESSLNYADESTILFNEQFYTYIKNAGSIQLYKSSDAISWSDITSSLNGLPSDAVVKNIKPYKDGLCVNTESGYIYISTDGLTWKKLSTAENVVNLLGSLKTLSSAEIIEKIIFIMKKDGKYLFASANENQLLYNTVKEVPDDFPIKSTFSAFTYEKALIPHLVVLGGYTMDGAILNTVWTTTSAEGGLSWGKLSQNIVSSSLIEGFNAFYYNSQIFLMNGKYMVEGNYNNSVYYSADGGISWKKAINKYLPPSTYDWRTGASVCVDKNNYFYILGGKNENQILTDIWNARLNRLSFK